MKKRILIFTAAALAAGLTACAPKAEETKPPVSIEETQGTQETEEPQTQDSEESQTQNSGAEETADSGPEPSDADMEAGETVQISDELLAKIYTAVKREYGENYIPSMMFDEAMLNGTFGIRMDQVDSYVAEGPMISAHVETFIGIKAKEGKAADVEKALGNYRKKQIEESLQYPMNMPKLEASQVITHGDYVFFIMLGSPDMEAEEQGEEAALESAKKNNQIAVDTIAGFFE